MIKRICIYILILLFKLTPCFSQQVYDYKVENPERYKFDSLLYDGIMFEFTGIRTYIEGTNTFYETNFLRVVDTFKISNDNWYIKENRKWRLFFSENNFRKKEIVRWKNVYLKPFEVRVKNNQLLYLYYLNTEPDFSINKNDIYSCMYFSKEIGIIKIDYDKFSLIRIWR